MYYTVDENGEEVKLDPPKGDELPKKGFAVEDLGYQAPAEDGRNIEIKVDPNSCTGKLLKGR